MKNSISKRDWETISAYLDRQLSQRDQARFESRLYSDYQLQDALHKMRRTREVLRGAPRLRSPRNFFLTPEIAGNPVRIPHLAPVFGWASAVASFLLVLVLVGDFLTGGGIEPVGLITSQQNIFVAQRSEIIESDVWVQPAVSEEMSVSSKSIVESAGGVESPEEQTEVAPMDIAADEPVMESVPSEEELLVESQESELQEMEMAAAAEEPTPENPEEIAAAATSEFTNGTPAETRTDSSVEGSDEAQDAAENSEQRSVDLTEGDDLTEQVEAEAIQEQPTELAEPKELPLQAMAEQYEQPTSMASETTMVADEKVYQAEQMTSDDSGDEIVIETDTITEYDTIPGTVSAPTSEKDLVLGLEAILALGALGTGLAWIYTRRRVI